MVQLRQDAKGFANSSLERPETWACTSSELTDSMATNSPAVLGTCSEFAWNQRDQLCLISSCLSSDLGKLGQNWSWLSRQAQFCWENPSCARCWLWDNPASALAPSKAGATQSPGARVMLTVQSSPSAAVSVPQSLTPPCTNRCAVACKTALCEDPHPAAPNPLPHRCASSCWRQCQVVLLKHVSASETTGAAPPPPLVVCRELFSGAGKLNT